MRAENPPVGTRVKFYWLVDEEYYLGEIVGYSEEGKAKVHYDDTDNETIDISEEIWDNLESNGLMFYQQERQL